MKRYIRVEVVHGVVVEAEGLFTVELYDHTHNVTRLTGVPEMEKININFQIKFHIFEIYFYSD